MSTATSVESAAKIHPERSLTLFDNFANLGAQTGQIESNYDEVTDSFDAMNLKAELLRGMYKN